MAHVVASVSMSLDGFIAGPDARPGNPLDDGGRLHRWISSPTEPDRRVLDQWDIPAGVVIVGRRMFDEGEEPWGDDPPWHLPVLVLTHETRPTVAKRGGTSYRFVSVGIPEALRLAREIAGEKDVMVGGGGETVSRFLHAGVLDELRVHVVPVVFGAGRPLFVSQGGGRIELESVEVIASPSATHVRYRVTKTTAA